jgi:hypothetical protein
VLVQGAPWRLRSPLLLFPRMGPPDPRVNRGVNQRSSGQEPGDLAGLL